MWPYKQCQHTRAKCLQGSVTPWCPKSLGKKEIMCHFPCTSRELFIAQHSNENTSDQRKLMCLPKGIVQDQIQDVHVCPQTHSLSSQLPLIQYEGIPCVTFILIFTLPLWQLGRILKFREYLKGNSRPNVVGNYSPKRKRKRKRKVSEIFSLKI